MPDAHRRPDHGGLLLSSIYQECEHSLSRPSRSFPDIGADKPFFPGVVAQGQPLFRLDNSKQRAAVETARRKVAEVEAGLVVARTDILEAEGKIQEARSAHQQALEELETKQELFRRNPGIVPRRDIEKLQVAVEGRQATIAAATDGLQAADGCLADLAPLERTEPVAEGDHRCHLPRRRRGHYDVRAARRLTAPSPKFPHSSAAMRVFAARALADERRSTGRPKHSE